MKTKKSFVLFAGLSMLSFVLAACGGSSAPTAAPDIQTEAPAAVTEALATATEALATATKAPISPLFPTGRFIQSGKGEYGLTFNADGTFSVGTNKSTFIRGTYTADDTTFTETSNTGGCNTNVSFYYTFDGKNLTFTYAENPEDDRVDCDGRYADFNNVTYMFAEE